MLIFKFMKYYKFFLIFRGSRINHIFVFRKKLLHEWICQCYRCRIVNQDTHNIFIYCKFLKLFSFLNIIKLFQLNNIKNSLLKIFFSALL